MKTEIKLPHIMCRDAENWRDIPSEDQLVVSMKTGLGDIRPLATNGIIVYGERYDGTPFVFHITNMPKAESRGPVRRCGGTYKQKPRRSDSPTFVKNVDDLLL